MGNWRDYSNYKKRKNADGTFTYFVIADGEHVEVSKEIYTEYAMMTRKMKYLELDLKRDRLLQDERGRAIRDENGQSKVQPEREVSLEKLIDEDWDYPADELETEDFVLRQIEIDELHCCLGQLSDDERALIQALFYEGMTEREYAKEIGLSKTALHARKIKVLAILKDLLTA